MMNLDHAFAALANAKRRAIVARLVRGDAKVVELAKPLGISLPALFKHLKVLEDALIVTSEQRGKYGLCRLRREALASAAEWIDFHRTFWNVNFELDPESRQIDSDQDGVRKSTDPGAVRAVRQRAGLAPSRA
jgi:DNA-binding transcriptional ArsR family regulator